MTKRKQQPSYNREGRKGKDHGYREKGTEKSETGTVCTGVHALQAEIIGICGKLRRIG